MDSTAAMVAKKIEALRVTSPNAKGSLRTVGA
jgi:hypothetical protein